MVIGTTLLIISVLIAAIWIIIEIKRFKHKIFAVFLIAIILFFYLSFTLTIKGQNIDLKTVPGLIEASKTYLIWVGSAFENIKSITANVVGMDWTNNETIYKTK